MASIELYETARGRRYRVRYRTPDREQTDKRGFRTKREAEEYLATVEVSEMRGEWVDPSRGRITIAEWAEQWFAAQLQIKATTAGGYRLWIDNHIVPTWGRRRLVDVGHAEVQAWVTRLASDHAPSTVRQIYFVFSMMMKFAIRDGRVSRNPCEAVQLPRIVRKRRSYLTHMQVHRLAAECGEYGDLVLFSRTPGCGGER